MDRSLSLGGKRWQLSRSNKLGRGGVAIPSWLDKGCINQDNIDDNLAALPIFLSGCQRSCLGPSYRAASGRSSMLHGCRWVAPTAHRRAAPRQAGSQLLQAVTEFQPQACAVLSGGGPRGFSRSSSRRLGRPVVQLGNAAHLTLKRGPSFDSRRSIEPALISQNSNHTTA